MFLQVVEHLLFVGADVNRRTERDLLIGSMAQQQDGSGEGGSDDDDDDDDDGGGGDDDDDDDCSYAPGTPCSQGSEAATGSEAGATEVAKAAQPASSIAAAEPDGRGQTVQDSPVAGVVSSTAALEERSQGSEDLIDPEALLKQQQDGEDLSGSAEAVQNKRPPPPRPLLVPSLSLLLATPLHIAAYFGHTHVVDALLRNAACDVRARTAQGCTALHIAAGRGHLAVVARLLRCQGLELDTPDDLVNTAMHHAAGKGGQAWVPGYNAFYHRLCNQGTKYVSAEHQCVPCSRTPGTQVVHQSSCHSAVAHWWSSHMEIA
jgi:hypothetical protein